MSGSDYYEHLTHLTDSVGINPPPDQRLALELMVKQWRRLKSLQHAGTFHGGDQSISPNWGVTACPACPRPEDMPAKSASSRTPKRGNKDTAYHHRSHTEISMAFEGEADEQHDSGVYVDVVACPHGLKRACVVERASEWYVITSSLLSAALTLSSCNSHIDSSLPHEPLVAPGHDPVCVSKTGHNIQHPSILTKAADANTHCNELDEIFGTWNRRRIVALPGALLRRAKEILPQHVHCWQMYDALDLCIPEEFASAWSKMMVNWREDLTESEVRQELKQMDAIAFEEGRRRKTGFTTSQIVTMGLDLEEEQRSLCAEIAASPPTMTDVLKADLRERQNVLRSRIEAWHDAEQVLIPALASLRSGAANDLPAHAITLLLPSFIYSSIAFTQDFLDCEWRLREAQAYDALAAIRGYLQVIAYVRHIAHGMREDARAQIEVVLVFASRSIDELVVRYRDAQAALANLAEPLGTNGRQFLRELSDSDVRFVTERDARQRPSWIWEFGGTAFLKDEDLFDISRNKNLQLGKFFFSACSQHCLILRALALRTMWCRARARAFDISAERDLLLEEMDRAAAFHDAQSKWWEGWVNLAFPEHPDDSEFLEGVNAYAYRQASIRRAQEVHCSSLARVIRYWFSGKKLPDHTSLGRRPLSQVSLTSGGSSLESVQLENVGDDNV
ncbi:hypothetical protein GSI_04785 [Ganoderma sinense ZZ0214-1]|uniref:CxC2-like cysteine cluster KDZ transposase-associated domain-containing protein n=1 Tax=Ganoderma sinense ZZ0214-1 TaxID=1077348 RepID=A0A2G8SHS8_9APHY|nr:hypothetical protein GSI_04785 [Ganoderma sinense ZZ0214-1]